MAYIDLTRDTIIRRLEKASAAKTETRKKGRLTAKEVVEALNRPNIESPHELCEALVGEGILFRHGTGGFVSRASFFENGRLLIRPTEEELERGILIPGHRFLPLYDRELLPKEIELRMSGRKLKRRQVSVSLSGLMIYYSLFGDQNFYGLIASESDRNMNVITTGNAPEQSLVSISVFDMRRIYDTLSVHPDDYLVAELEDWRKGRFSIYPPEQSEVPNKSVRSKQRIAKWVEALDEGFEKVFSHIPWPLPPDEQLARAFYRAGRKIVDRPALHVGGYLEESSIVGLVTLGEETYLWDVRKKIGTEAISNAGMLEAGLSGSLFEELCTRHGLPIPMPYVEACVRHFMEESEERNLPFSHLLHNVFAGMNVEGLSYNQWFRLVDALEKYRKGFSPSEISDNKNSRHMRKKYILLYKEVMRWILSNEVHFGSLEAADEEHIRDLVDTAMRSVDSLHVLNSKGTLEEKYLKGLEEMYRNLTKSFHRLTRLIYEELKDGERRSRREKRLSCAAAAEYTVLDVELEGLDPPVFRRLRVPGTMSLRDLHELLQVSFEWEDYHLHTFYLDGIEYTDLETWEPDFADVPEPRDEAQLLVEDLADLCNEFLYVYDFGDDWHHRITLQEVVQASEVPRNERESAVCLEGTGAGPPEDCGGVSGYAELVDAVETLEEERDDEQVERVLWAGEWRPDAFSLQELNLLLEKL